MWWSVVFQFGLFEYWNPFSLVSIIKYAHLPPASTPLPTDPKTHFKKPYVQKHSVLYVGFKLSYPNMNLMKLLKTQSYLLQSIATHAKPAHHCTKPNLRYFLMYCYDLKTSIIFIVIQSYLHPRLHTRLINLREKRRRNTRILQLLTFFSFFSFSFFLCFQSWYMIRVVAKIY